MHDSLYYSNTVIVDDRTFVIELFFPATRNKSIDSSSVWSNSVKHKCCSSIYCAICEIFHPDVYSITSSRITEDLSVITSSRRSCTTVSSCPASSRYLSTSIVNKKDFLTTSVISSNFFIDSFSVDASW